MLNYDEFKKAIVNRIKSSMPEKLKDCQVEVGKRKSINETVDELKIVLKKITLSYRLKLVYEEYAKCGSLEEVMSSMAKEAMEVVKESPAIFKKLDYEKIKDHITMSLINTKQNEEFLKELPHREWHDLSIVYRWQLDIDDVRSHETLINHNLTAAVGLDEAKLYMLAEKNMRKMFPPTVEGMAEVLKKIMVIKGMPEELAEASSFVKPDNHSMYVISNDRNYHGAVSILFENVVHDLAEKLESNLFLLPASIHEFIAVPAVHDVNDMIQMVRDINATQVSFNERLSNQVYFYDKDSETIFMMPNVPKRLDD